MRVVLFDAYSHVLGGAQRTMVTIAQELLERGHEPTIMVPADGPVAAHARSQRVPVLLTPLPSALARFGRTTTGWHRAAAATVLPLAWARLRKVVAAARPAIVHVNDHRGALLMAPAARLAGAPVVWHAHSVDVPGRWIERTAGRFTATVVAPSQAALAALSHLPPQTPRTVVPAPIDATIRATVGPDPRGPVVTAARLHPSKGVDLALRAIALVRASGHPVRLDVFGGEQAGAEHHAAELRSLATDLGLDGHVTFHGHVDHPHQSWAGAALYLQTSRAETFGMAVAEAMRMGLPVVATRVGGLPELVADGRTGMLVDPGDPDAIATAVVSLLEDPDRARAIGAAARAATEHLTADRCTDALLEVWRRAVRRA